MELEVSRSSADGYPVVTVHGEVDVSSAAGVQRDLAELISAGTSSIVVDLTDVAFLDSTGLGALVASRASAEGAGGTMPLVCTSERILKLFTITGLDGVFKIYPSVAAALQSLGAEPGGG